MAAAAGASGARSWLQAQRGTWLTARRLRMATVALFTAAFGFSSLTITGSSAAQAHRTGAGRGCTYALSRGRA